MNEDPVEHLIAAYLERRIEGSAESVDDLIASHAEHATALRRRLGHLGMLGDLDPNRPTPGLAVPARFDGYEVVCELGRGGMGVVYEARQPSLQRSVAIKVIAGIGTFSARMRERFDREITTLGRISHPNIVKVFGSGTVAGSAYVAMELIRGESLARRVSVPGTRPDHDVVEETLRVAMKLARALDHVHELGVIHRDVKPANILIDSRGEPVLLDFGLARDDERETVTNTGEFVGTLLYVAPEQALGQHVDRRADVYGLAATVYHLVTGVPSHPARSVADLVRRIDSGRTRSALRANPGLPADLSLVLDHALAATPQMRYASCADLADDLQAVLDGRPIRAVRPSHIGRLVRWSRRRPAAATLIVVSGITLALVGWTGWRVHRDWVASERARLEHALEEAQAEILGHDFASAESILAAACTDWPNNREAWLLRIVGALSSRGAGKLSHVKLRVEQVTRARELLARSPAELQQEPAGVVLSSLLESFDPNTRDFAAEWKPPPLHEDLDAAAAIRLARTLYRVAFRNDDALAVLRPVVQTDPTSFAAHVLLAQLLRDSGTLEGHRSAVLAHAMQPTKAGPLDTLALCTLRIASRKDGADLVALTNVWPLFERALELEPRNAVVKADYAYALMQAKPSGWESRAEQLLRESVALETIPTAHWNLKNLLWTSGQADPREMLELLHPVEQHYGWMSNYWEIIGRSTLQLDGPAAAVQALRPGLEQVESAERYRILLLEVEFRAGMEGQNNRLAMLAAWDEAVESAPRDATGLNALLESLASLKDTDRIKRWATLALELHAAGLQLDQTILDELARQGMPVPSPPGP